MASLPPIPSPLSHAYIITGGTAGGRRDYARLLAQTYVCGSAVPPCGQCRSCRKAAEGIHPDVILLAPEEGKREILVGQARALRSDAHIRPNEAPRKVYVIDGAEAMNPAAQNALLKLLEDGPGYAAFLLLTAQPGALLQTVRSRCEILSLPPQEEDPSSPEAVQGAAELLLRLAGKDELALAEFCVSLEKWGREDMSALLREEISLFRHALAAPAGADLPSFDNRQILSAVREAADGLSAPQLMAAAGLCRRLDAACGFNTGAGHLAGWLCAGLAEILAGKSVPTEEEIL